MNKYGDLALLDGYIGEENNGGIEFFFPLKLSMPEYRMVKIDRKYIYEDKLKVIIVNYDDNAVNVDIMLSNGDTTVFTVDKNLLTLRPRITLLKKILFLKQKLSELHN